jgi:acyl transferase domain-containing protein
VNNFGYGGANAHAIIDAYLPPGSIEPVSSNGFVTGGAMNHQESPLGTGSGQAQTAARSDMRKIFVLSGKDRAVTSQMAIELAGFVNEHEVAGHSVDLARLAHTLAARRSRFSWRFATTAQDAAELASALQDSNNKPMLARGTPRIGFVFNGQGAQWAAMGKGLFKYPVFASAMEEADRVLRSYGASWSLIGKTFLTYN